MSLAAVRGEDRPRSGEAGAVAHEGRRSRDGAGQLAALHPDWRSGWGETLAGEELRAQLEANPRLGARIVAQIAATHGASLSGRPKLERTASAVADALGADRIGFIRLCGLCHIGRRLALATNASDYAALVSAFGREALATAARVGRELTDEIGDHGYDSEQLVPAVDRTGHVVLREWVQTLPGEEGEWMRMLMPRERGQSGMGIGSARAVAIVRGAAAHWRPSATPTREGTGRSVSTRRPSRRRAR